MSTALDGPTSEVNTSRNGIARRSAARRHPRRAGDVKIETKSRDQRYDNCVARVALERAPNGIFPSITPVRTTQSKTSTREACMVNSWNLAANCKYVVMSVCGPIQYFNHCNANSVIAPPNGKRCSRTCEAATRLLQYIATFRCSVSDLQPVNWPSMRPRNCSRSERKLSRNLCGVRCEEPFVFDAPSVSSSLAYEPCCLCSSASILDVGWRRDERYLVHFNAWGSLVAHIARRVPSALCRKKVAMCWTAADVSLQNEERPWRR
jgi:hypothetical protein